MHILVVDDEPVQIESLRRGLRTKGYKVIEALNAKEALSHLNSGKDQIDLVLVDYALPEMNGIELLKVIRETNGFLPVIIMTGYVRMKDVINLLHHRCDGFIEKPFTLNQLLQEIERVRASRNPNVK